MDLFGVIREEKKYKEFGPNPDIAICSKCRGRFHYTECPTVEESESWEMPEKYLVYFCPECEDGGEIDDWEYSPSQQKLYEEWLKEKV